MSNSTLGRRGWDPIHRSGIIIAVPLALLLASCDEEPPTHATDVPEVTALDRTSSFASMATASTMNLPLPFSGTLNSSATAFFIKQDGIGRNGYFQIANSSNNGAALTGITIGPGPALSASNGGLGRGAIVSASNPLNTSPALELSSYSLGTFTGATAVLVNANNSSATMPTVTLNTSGRGPLFKVNHRGTAGDLAIFQTASSNKIRFSRTSRGYFNGGTQLGGADLAEAFEVEGSVRAYEPGDVLTISEGRDRTVEKSDEPYSTRVIGVYATRPGVLLTERDIDASLDDMVPVGVIGVLPTRVSAENGAIRRGDLLVSARTPGYAMLGTERDRMLGAVIGKALAEFSGPGSGTIRVLVNVK